ncbi:MAG: type IV pili methyl-accepting chemotaxis transducer N-terminal domain-containing protein [Desulfotalea sp.]
MNKRKATVIETMICRSSLAVVVLLVAFQSQCFAEGPSAAEYGIVLNLSGKQRMLSQKMSKEVVLIALDVNKEENLKNLQGTAKLFNKTLKGLKDGNTELRLPPTTNGRIRNQLGKIEKIWIDFNEVLQGILAHGKVTPVQLQAVASQNLPLLKQMNKCVLLYEKDASKAGLQSDPSLAVTINLSGKQRMLSQKMSKEFLLIAYGHDIENNKLNLLETYSLFERTLKGLLDGDDTLDLPATENPKIRQQLGKIDMLWVKFKPIVSFGAEPSTTSIPKEKIKTVAKANLPLLKEMNIAVGMYEKESAK